MNKKIYVLSWFIVGENAQFETVWAWANKEEAEQAMAVVKKIAPEKQYRIDEITLVDKPAE